MGHLGGLHQHRQGMGAAVFHLSATGTGVFPTAGHFVGSLNSGK